MPIKQGHIEQHKTHLLLTLVLSVRQRKLVYLCLLHDTRTRRLGRRRGVLLHRYSLINLYLGVRRNSLHGARIRRELRDLVSFGGLFILSLLELLLRLLLRLSLRSSGCLLRSVIESLRLLLLLVVVAVVCDYTFPPLFLLARLGLWRGTSRGRQSAAENDKSPCYFFLFIFISDSKSIA